MLYFAGYVVSTQMLRLTVLPSAATPSKVLHTTPLASFGAFQLFAGAPALAGQSPSRLSLLSLSEPWPYFDCSAGVSSSTFGRGSLSWL